MTVAAAAFALLLLASSAAAGRQLRSAEEVLTCQDQPASGAVALGGAANYAIFAGKGITTVPNSVITGDVGISPAAITAVTGFSLTADASGTFSTSLQVVGELFGPAHPMVAQAKFDLGCALTNAAGRTLTESSGSNDLSGLTLTAGIYESADGFAISSGELTIEGTDTDIFIFKMASTLTIASGVKVVLSGGALAKNIFWVVGSSASIGTTAHVEGIILASDPTGTIAMMTGSSINGRILAAGIVTLQKTTVTQPPTAAGRKLLEESTPAVELNTAANYAILAGSGITTVPQSAITGDVGISPASIALVTGFSFLTGGEDGSTSDQVTGTVFGAETSAVVAAALTQAKLDLDAAFIDAAPFDSVTKTGRTGVPTADDMTGVTFTSGVYSADGFYATKDFTISGGADDVFIFQSASTLMMAAGAKVILAGGVQAKNIFWHVGSSASIGTTAHVEGIIMAKETIAMMTGSSINGRLLARNAAVTLQMTTVTAPSA
jgi:hypothetical protein